MRADHARERELRQLIAAFFQRQLDEAVAKFLAQRGGQVFDVIAVITVIRKRLGDIKQCHVTRADGVTQHANARAGVVDVIFAPGFGAGRLKQIHEHVADRSRAGADDIQGAGRVGADKLHIDYFAGAGC